MERISSASRRVSEDYPIRTQSEMSRRISESVLRSSTCSDSPAQPGGAEPAPLGRHDGAGRGRPHVLRAGQGHGSASELPRLHLLPPPGPGPRGLSGISGNFAYHQPQGGLALSSRCLRKAFSHPVSNRSFLSYCRRET